MRVSPGRYLCLCAQIPAIAEYSSNEVMGHSADRLAAAFQVSRKEQDEYGLRSHACAAEAARKGWLVDLFPFKVPGVRHSHTHTCSVDTAPFSCFVVQRFASQK